MHVSLDWNTLQANENSMMNILYVDPVLLKLGSQNNWCKVKHIHFLLCKGCSGLKSTSDTREGEKVEKCYHSVLLGFFQGCSVLISTDSLWLTLDY